MIGKSMAARLAFPATEDAGEHVRSKVLVVDDDERNLLALREVLDDIAEVVCAGSGEEALRRLLQEQFAVIVLDVLMPGLDGYETAALIRAREQSRDTPIIFLTAINKEDAHLLRGYDTGAVDFVFKPVEPTIVRSKVSVFVSLFEKTAEIQRTSAIQKRLLEEKLEAQQQSLVAAQALREAEERQELILSSLPLAVYVEDPRTGAMSFVVGNISDLCGFEDQDFRDDAELFASRVLPLDALHFASPIKDGRRNREYRWQHPDGSVRTFLDQAVVLSGQAGTVAGTVRDITEQRLMQDQLVQAQKMDAIGKLTGGVAHDFNNLLASVLGGLDILERRSRLEGKALEVFQMTRHAAEQGKHLVSRLLAFSRRQNLAPTAVDLPNLSHSIHALLGPILGGLVQLDWKLSDDIWDVFVDPSQLELAIMNLAINSRDAMPAGGEISIRMRNSDGIYPDELAPGDYVVITISDTGSGIPPELVNRVLEPFFTTKEVGRGTGLGLSMAYGFAKQSGGTLCITSEPGRGTDVELWLPRNRAPVQAAPQHACDEVASCEQGRSRHVLLVDDSPTLRHMTAVQLRDRGFEVTSASSGVEAIAMIEQDPDRYDVLLTDYAMPMMSGLDLIKAARRKRSGFPAILITGYAEIEALEARPADVALVTKPCSADSLSRVIAQTLGPALASSAD
jgi:signal transduction histidine kinase/two-component SAPR family response regulator